MITQDGYDFGGSPLHGDIVAAEPYELPIEIGQWFGVQNEAHIVGEQYGRPLVCDYTLDGFSTAAALKAQLKAIDRKVGQLSGDVVMTGPLADTKAQCTFLGYEQTPIFRDGSGVNGWVHQGRLIWRQRVVD